MALKAELHTRRPSTDPMPALDRTRYGAGIRAEIDAIFRRVFRPLPKLSLLEWSERYRHWKDDMPYRAAATPHIREILDAYSDPSVEEITIVKPTQAGMTEGLLVNGVGYHMHHDPRDLLVVTPTAEEAKKWSRKKLQPAIDATPVLQGLLQEGSRKSSDTILEKSYPGGSIGMIGANSARGFRMVTVGTVFSDDVDAWETTAGKGERSEGDQVTLIRRRAERIADRKLCWVSSPTRPDARILVLYDMMERRGEFHVPCPHCSTMQVLEWGGPGQKHGMKWETEKVERSYKPKQGEVKRGGKVHRPDTAHYVCVNGCVIDELEKPDMEAAGRYLTEAGEAVLIPGTKSVGFWLKGALTITLPGSEWPKLVREFLQVVDFPDKLMSFYNTVLALPWERRGDSPEWKRLFERREPRPLGIVPKGVVFLTFGVDVQQTWVEGYCWGWGWDRESWLIDHVVIDGDITGATVKAELTKMLHRTYPIDGSGEQMPVAGLAIDTGHNQMEVAGWYMGVRDPRVMLIKGDHWKNWSVIVGSPSKNQVTYQGKKFGFLLWPVGSALVKQETYGFLGLERDGEEFPPGWIHLPQVDDEVCRQLCSEDLVTTTDPQGFPHREWAKNRPRNEALDARSYARAAAERHGLSRMIGDRPSPPKRPPPDDPGTDTRPDGWLGRGGKRPRSPRGGRGGWLRR